MEHIGRCELPDYMREIQDQEKAWRADDIDAVEYSEGFRWKKRTTPIRGWETLRQFMEYRDARDLRLPVPSELREILDLPDDWERCVAWDDWQNSIGGPWLGAPPKLEDEAEAMGVPPLFRSACVENFRPQDFAGGQPLETDEPRNLLIVGANGTGKSHLAAALATRWRARWASAAEFVVEVRSTFGNSQRDEQSVFNRYAADYGRLVLDDLTAVNSSEFAVASLLAVLDKRIGWLRPTIVTCYQTAEEVRKLDPSIASRLSGFETVALVGGDRRKAKR